jgi:hypothetical protein
MSYVSLQIEISEGQLEKCQILLIFFHLISDKFFQRL